MAELLGAGPAPFAEAQHESADFPSHLVEARHAFEDAAGVDIHVVLQPPKSLGVVPIGAVATAMGAAHLMGPDSAAAAREACPKPDDRQLFSRST